MTFSQNVLPAKPAAVPVSSQVSLNCLPQCPAPCLPPVSPFCGPSFEGGGCCLSHHICYRSHYHRHQNSGCCGSGNGQQSGNPAAQHSGVCGTGTRGYRN
uniref:Keratin associated protein 25-1 n=1 Tax=Felis catus TaxID=9685 RepID=A0ABI7ZZS9_FELCA